MGYSRLLSLWATSSWSLSLLGVSLVASAAFAWQKPEEPANLSDRVRDALKLVTTSNEKLGWQALALHFRSIATLGKQKELEKGLASEVESAARKSNSTEAALATYWLYRADEPLRRRVLGSDAEDFLFRSAFLAESTLSPGAKHVDLLPDSPPTKSGAGHLALKLLHQASVDQLKKASLDRIGEIARNSDLGFPEPISGQDRELAVGFARLGLSGAPAVRKIVLGENAEERLNELLLSTALAATSSPHQVLLRQACRGVLDRRSKDRLAGLSVQQILEGIDASRFDGSRFDPPRDSLSPIASVDPGSKTEFTKIEYTGLGDKQPTVVDFAAVAAKIDYSKQPEKAGPFKMESDRNGVPVFLYRLEESKQGAFDDIARRAGAFPPNTTGNQQAVIDGIKSSFHGNIFAYAVDISSSRPADSARANVTVVDHQTELFYGKLGETPGWYVGLGGGEVNVRTSVRFALRPKGGTRWVACRTFEKAGYKADVSGPNPIAFPVACSGTLTKEPCGVEPGTNWRVFCLVPESGAEFVILHPHNERRWMRVQVEVLELDPSNCEAFPKVPLLDLAAESPNGLLSYAASLNRAVEPGGWLLESREDDPGLSAALSLARLNLLDVCRRGADGRFPAKEAEGSPWRQRRSFLEQALPIVAREVFRHRRPALELEIQRADQNLYRLKEIYMTLQQGIVNYNKLSQDERWQLLSRNEQTLQVDSPHLKENQELLKSALFGASESILEDIQHTQARRLLAVDMLKRLRYAGDRLIPAFASDTVPEEVTRGRESRP